MSTQTTNYGLVKPDVTDFYDVDVMNDNLDVIDTTLKSKADQTEVDSLKKSVSDGKTTVANAITGQGVTTATDATFATMATNIATVGTNKYNAGVSATKIGTATAAQVLSGYTFTNASTVGATGTMVNNGAVNQALSINGSYTIPVGYHNGSGKVTQSITTKAAATYTPGDSVQTIAAGQYLSGVQTISTVPTETKTTTAGTSATTVSRTSGKYMTSVTVNPTPSQTKSVTMTSSPMTITPDAGKLLSSVTVSANLGKRYASGSVFTSSGTRNHYYKGFTYTESVDAQNSSHPIINLGLSWTPRIVKAQYSLATGYTVYATLVLGDTYGMSINKYDSGGSEAMLWYFIGGNYSGNEVYFPSFRYGAANISNLIWEAWE